MANFNKVLLMGNLTRDPQLSYLPSQTAVVDFSLAVNRRWTGKDGEKKEETCFVDCQAFGRAAENINKYLSKGKPIFIEGRLKFEKWETQVGGEVIKRSKLKVTVERFQFLGSPSATVRPEQSPPDSPEDSQAEQQGGNDDIPF